MQGLAGLGELFDTLVVFESGSTTFHPSSLGPGSVVPRFECRHELTRIDFGADVRLQAVHLPQGAARNFDRTSRCNRISILKRVPALAIARLDWAADELTRKSPGGDRVAPRPSSPRAAFRSSRDAAPIGVPASVAELEAQKTPTSSLPALRWPLPPLATCEMPTGKPPGST